jgi:hypothetical protein
MNIFKYILKLNKNVFICFSCEVAKNIPADSYALVFGINTFFTLVLQTCLTVIVNSPVGFMLNIRTQVRLLLLVALK